MLRPHKLVLLSPWIDLGCSGASFTTNSLKDKILSRENLTRYALWYTGKNDMETANPATRLGHAFPPTFIAVGGDEVLLDDAVDAYRIILKNQALTHLHIFPGCGHVWLLDDISTDASRRLLAGIFNFIHQTH